MNLVVIEPAKQTFYGSAKLKKPIDREGSTVWISGGHLVVEFADPNPRKNTAALATWSGLFWALERGANQFPEVKAAILALAGRLRGGE